MKKRILALALSLVLLFTLSRSLWRRTLQNVNCGCILTAVCCATAM